MNVTLLEAENVTKLYDGGSVHALRGVNLRIEAGEFVAIMGPSGSGKTTLLHLLGALDDPTSGALRYRGKPLPRPRAAAAYRSREVGFVFQAFHLLPTFTAAENVQIPMLEAPGSAAGRRGRAEELLAAVGMGHRSRHYPNRMSGGERQRVAIARSLANAPQVLLADEPTGNLDSENARGIMDLLTGLHRERGLAIVLITHDPGVGALAQRTLHMKDGRVIDSAP